MAEERRPQHEVPYLHVRPPRRVVGVGGEGDRQVARITANRAGLLALKEQMDRALAAEGRYRETDLPTALCYVLRFPLLRKTNKEEKMRRMTLLVAVVSILVVAFAGVALAKNFQCTNRICEGTNNPDTIYERGGDGINDNIYGQGGGDRLLANRFGDDTDNLYGQQGADTLNADDGDGNDTLQGGTGNDTCYGDAADNPATEADEGDTYIGCETIFINGVEQP